MKLAICACEGGLDSRVDQRFGRCPGFVIVDPEKEEQIEFLRNDNAAASGGAGPQSAALLSESGVEAVALGNIGPNAVIALEAAGIAVYTGIEGTVRETMHKFRDGKLQPVKEATVSPHFGLKD